MIKEFFVGKFTEILIVLVLALLSSTSWLCFQNKVNQQRFITAQNDLNRAINENKHLENQIENAVLQIHQYQQQVKDLHNNVLDKMQKAETRTNEIMDELENQKNWRDHAVPPSIGKLFQQRASSEKRPPDSPDLPNGSTLPESNIQHKNQW